MKSRASKHADLLSESDVNKRADIESKEDGSEWWTADTAEALN